MLLYYAITVFVKITYSFVSFAKNKMFWRRVKDFSFRRRPRGDIHIHVVMLSVRLTLTVSTPTLTPSTSAVTIKFILVNSSNFCQKLICLTTAQSCRFPTENRIPNRILYQSILHLQNYLFISIDICSGLCSCSTIRWLHPTEYKNSKDFHFRCISKNFSHFHIITKKKKSYTRMYTQGLSWSLFQIIVAFMIFPIQVLFRNFLCIIFMLLYTQKM